MTVNDYLNRLPEERIEPMVRLTELVKEVFPEAEEGMLYKMPTYSLEGEVFCSMASQKHYMALYIMPYDLLGVFSDQLKKYNCGKSCIRFKQLKEEDLNLFKEILEFTGKNYPSSLFYGRIKTKKK